MTRTTPPRPLDVLAEIPELAAYARTTTRLHPRRGAPSVQDSSIGGPLLWPEDEPWPVDADGHVPPNSLVAIAQLHAADVPTIPFPDGKDLLQILWCPVDHAEVPGQRFYSGPSVQLFWRRAEDVDAVLTEPPKPHTANGAYYLPEPCVLHPEQVTEYQYIDLLPPALRERLKDADEQWEDEADLSYQHDLSMASGCKAGGWASWHLTDPWHLTCSACGADYDLLVKFASCEWDGVVSWTPLEDDPDDHEAQLPTGLTHGRWGEMRIFVCSADLGHPFALSIQ